MSKVTHPIDVNEGRRPLVSVVIVTRNGERWLERLLNSIRETKYPNLEVTVVDNGSTDKTAELLQGRSDISVVRSETNLGYAGGNNLGASRCRGQYLFFLNDDTWVETDSIGHLTDVAQSDPSIGFCAAEVCEYETNNEVSCGILLDIFGFPSGNARSTAHPSNHFFYADGCALFVDARLFQTLEGFDRNHFIFAEDSDLCWRGALLGWRTVSVPGARVHHYSGGSTTHQLSEHDPRYTTEFTVTAFRRSLTERNTLVNVLRNYSTTVLILLLPIYLLTNLMEALTLAITRRGEGALGVYVLSWGSVVKRIPEVIVRRRAVQNSRVVRDRELMRRMMWTYSKGALVMKRGVPHFTRGQ